VDGKTMCLIAAAVGNMDKWTSGFHRQHSQALPYCALCATTWHLYKGSTTQFAGRLVHTVGPLGLETMRAEGHWQAQLPTSSCFCHRNKPRLISSKSGETKT